jgi:hypothetical protein
MTETTVTIADSQITFSASKATVQAVDRGAHLKRLRRARRDIAMGEENIFRLHEIIGRLERGGHDSSVAKELLARFQKLQEGLVADHDRLEKQFAQLPR